MSNIPNNPGVAATFATPDGTPVPLRPEPLPMPKFPLEALGSLQNAVKACQKLGNVHEAVAAQSILGAATLATQGLANVEFPGGKTLPLSCFFITIADSGDGKTSSSNYALEPIFQRQKELEAQRKKEMPTWRIQNARWQKQMNELIKSKEVDLGELAIEPQCPPLARLILSDLTFEGLYKLFRDGQPSLGILTSEGGQFVGGHGMLSENMLRMLCGLSSLWDGGVLDRVRASEDASCIYGRRLAIHLMLQPSVAEILLSNPIVKGQGFLSRCLTVAPETMAGKRHCDINPDPSLLVEIEKYSRRMLEIMRLPTTTLPGTQNELNPRCMRLTPNQKEVWRDYQHLREDSRGSEGYYDRIPEFAAKIPSHILRLAGILTLVDDPTADLIHDAALAGAIKLGEFYLEEALRLEMLRTGDPQILHAEQLYAWLKKKNLDEFEVRYVQRHCPRHLRNGKILKSALNLLKEHGCLKQSQDTDYRVV